MCVCTRAYTIHAEQMVFNIYCCIYPRNVKYLPYAPRACARATSWINKVTVYPLKYVFYFNYQLFFFAFSASRADTVAPATNNVVYAPYAISTFPLEPLEIGGWHFVRHAGQFLTPSRCRVSLSDMNIIMPVMNGAVCAPSCEFRPLLLPASSTK